jgi:hypothetical protein
MGKTTVRSESKKETCCDTGPCWMLGQPEPELTIVVNITGGVAGSTLHLGFSKGSALQGLRHEARRELRVSRCYILAQQHDLIASRAGNRNELTFPSPIMSFLSLCILPALEAFGFVQYRIYTGEMRKKEI